MSRKQRFDCIDDLRTEVTKRARRTPIKLGLLGIITKKRPLSALKDNDDDEGKKSAPEKDNGKNNKKK